MKLSWVNFEALFVSLQGFSSQSATLTYREDTAQSSLKTPIIIGLWITTANTLTDHLKVKKVYGFQAINNSIGIAIHMLVSSFTSYLQALFQKCVNS